MDASIEALDGTEAYKWPFVHPFNFTGRRNSRDYFCYWSAGQRQRWVKHKTELFLLLNLECFCTIMAGLRNSLGIARNVSLGHFHHCRHKWRNRRRNECCWGEYGQGTKWCCYFVLEMTYHFKSPLEGDSLGAATMWVHWLQPSVPSLQ